MSLRVNDDKLLEKSKIIWNKIEGFLNIKLEAVPVSHDKDKKIWGIKFILFSGDKCL